MIKANDFTIAIVTLQRSQLLKKLLLSLQKQTLLPGEVLIVDNDPQQSAFAVCQKFNDLPLKYLAVKQMGTPVARNAALQATQTPYLCFVDDDCVLAPTWFEGLYNFLSKSETKDPYFIQGQSLLLNRGSFWARQQHQRYRRWFKNLIVKHKFHPLGLDTKNICLNLRRLKKDGISFDQRYGNLPISGSEDTDLGVQIAQHGGWGSYCSEMIIWHRETEGLWQTLKKVFAKGRLSARLQKKWQFCDRYQRSAHRGGPLSVGSILQHTLFNFNQDLADRLLTVAFLLGVKKGWRVCTSVFC